MITPQIQSLINAGAIFYVSHSGGKDSQAMYALMLQHIPHHQIEVIHASLGDVEWPGVIAHIQENIEHELNIVQANKTFLGMVESRGMWPSAQYRQCTSDLKRGPIQKFIRHDIKRRGGGIAVNCMGLRAQESAARAKRQPLRHDKRQSAGVREVYDWLPIFDLTTELVFQAIADVGQKPHWAYKTGNERLSCMFCIMGSRNDLRNAAKQNAHLYRRYVSLERKTEHTMFTKAGKPIWLDEYIGIPVTNIDCDKGGDA
ncbi:phosphoadenosine phosphosulfate reductase domain-containing protein [Pectobacterium versatile]|uniref:phosphoadenosine phosphosulfate reductase domain-containing protein n=1 Tax=Pectobacterium versatile TaxID=2488639 RepID=UPI001F29D24A|nr:phosphoadenosine phosphosulfate reductase family protein [Pectobacterium versatile]